MLPFIIAGAVGFGIAKLLEKEETGKFADGGHITTNDEIIESFLTSNKDLKLKNLQSVEIDDIMYLRNYQTFVAKRQGDKVKISSQKYSPTTSTITNRVKSLAQKMGYSVEYVSEKEIYDFDKFADGGQTKRRRRANAQVGRSDRSIDKTRVAKPVGYRFTDALATKLRKDKYAVPTEKQVGKYNKNGIYKENRRNKSDRDRTAKI